MKQNFSIGRGFPRIAQAAAMVALVGSLLSPLVHAAGDPELQDNVPERYTVVKGDTLWGISGKFLKQPWRWPEVWRMNKEQIRNPHRIYPGDVVVLDRIGGKPYLRLLGGRETVRLSPETRISEREKEAIPSIPSADIEPFLTRPLVIEPEEMANAPKVISTRDKRVMIATGNTVYVLGVPEAEAQQGSMWQLYRPGRTLKHVTKVKVESFWRPGEVTYEDKEEILGIEAVHVGDARLVAYSGEVATYEVVRAKEEVLVGDRLVKASKEVVINYVPHAPEQPVKGSVIALPGGVAEGGRHSIVVLNLGTRNGMEVGHVLALHRQGESVKVENREEPVKLPDERIGLLFVFRVFDKVSYALVMSTSRQVYVDDMVTQP